MDLSNPGIKPGFPSLHKDSLPFELQGSPKGQWGEMIVITYDNNNIDEKEKGEKVKREGKENISTKYDIVEKKEVAIPKPLTVWITMNCGKF